MMTIATIDDRDPDIAEVFVDLDDSGHFYLKQGSDWVALSLTSKQTLIEALRAIGDDLCGVCERPMIRGETICHGCGYDFEKSATAEAEQVTDIISRNPVDPNEVQRLKDAVQTEVVEPHAARVSRQAALQAAQEVCDEPAATERGQFGVSVTESPACKAEQEQKNQEARDYLDRAAERQLTGQEMTEEEAAACGVKPAREPHSDDRCTAKVHSFNTEDAELCECGKMRADGSYVDPWHPHTESCNARIGLGCNCKPGEDLDFAVERNGNG